MVTRAELRRQKKELRDRQIAALAAAGMWPSDIARKIGLSAKAVRAIITAARKNGHDIPRVNGQIYRHVAIPASLFDSLTGPAKARSMTRAELAHRIIARVVMDGLVEAIVDDKGRAGV